MSRTNAWTEERRAKERAAIQRWRPWGRSTGPRTADGKAGPHETHSVGAFRRLYAPSPEPCAARADCSQTPRETTDLNWALAPKPDVPGL